MFTWIAWVGLRLAGVLVFGWVGELIIVDEDLLIVVLLIYLV